MAKTKTSGDGKGGFITSLRVDQEILDKIERTRKCLGGLVGNPKYKKADAVRWLLAGAREPR